MSTAFSPSFYFLLLAVCFWLMGVSGSNIFHFAIEDHYKTDMISSYLLGLEYARSQSVLLISAFFYYGLLFLKRYVPADQSVKQKRYMIFFLCMLAAFIGVYLVAVVYQFFSGRSEIHGLYRILVTIVFGGLGCALIFLRLSTRPFVLCFSTWIEGIAVGLLCVLTTIITVHYAAPNAARGFYKDTQTLTHLLKVSDKIDQYYRNNKQLPDSLKQLDEAGYLKQFTFDAHTFSYTAKKSNMYEMCGVFLTNRQDFRRISVKKFLSFEASEDLPFKKGTYCFRYQLPAPEKKGSTRILVSSYVQVN